MKNQRNVESAIKNPSSLIIHGQKIKNAIFVQISVGTTIHMIIGNKCAQVQSQETKL